MGRAAAGAAALLCLLLLQILLPCASAIEVGFTPNPQDSVEKGGDGGPLPQSLQQRRQLLELEAAIANSGDPSATLGHVAQQNGLSPEELAGMLQRNRKELAETGQLEGMVGEVNAAMQAQMGGGRGLANSLPRRVLSLVVSIVAALLKTASAAASRHPGRSAILAVLLACALLAAHNAPRNGIVVSPGFPTPLTRGRTTLLEPPADYLERVCVRAWEGGGWRSSLPAPVEVEIRPEKKSSKSRKRSPRTVGGIGMTRSLEVDPSLAMEGEVLAETRVSTADGFALVATAQALITTDAIVDDDGANTEEEDDESVSELREEAADCLLESIESVFQERKFSEFIPGDSRSLKFRSFLVASEDDEDDITEGAAVALKLLGDFGRYGVQPLRVSYESDEEEDDEGGSTMHRVAFHTLAGGHFDGELRFAADATGSGADDAGVAVDVVLAIPAGGRAPPARLAEALVSSLARSIAESCRVRTRQALSRRRQSQRYRKQAKGRASEKRHLRYVQEKLQEEMAAERKRKWKRNNPDAGHYRPTGKLRSPNSGGPRHGF